MKPKLIGKKHLNSALFGLVMALVMLGNVNTAWSDHRDYRNDYYRSDRRQVRDDIREFQDFLQSHPKVATELQNNPGLVYNRKYLDKHEDLSKFLRRHPAVQQEVANNPERVFGRYYANDRRYGPFDGLWDWGRGWGWGRR